MSDNKIQKQKVDEEELDLIALAKQLWNGRKTVIKVVIIFIFLGLFFAIFSPKEYTSSTTMVPQINNPSTKIGGLSSLASLAGFDLDLNMGSIELSPMLYPQILSSISFQLEIMNTTYMFEELEHEVTLYEYYKEYYRPGILNLMKEYTVGLPGLILKSIRKAGQKENVTIETVITAKPIRITKEQDEIRKIIEENLSLSVNDKDGYLDLSARFHQAELSAQVAGKAVSLLQEYITEFKIEKARSQLSFIKERHEETQDEFEKAQSKLAAFRDANKNITSAVAQTELQRLENEYQLTFEVYSELAKQLEQARIKVKEDTPIFSVIEEVSVPVEKSKPNRPLILIIWTFLGVVIGVGWIFGRELYQNLQKIWNEN